LTTYKFTIFVVVLQGAYFAYSRSGPALTGGRPESKLACGSLGAWETVKALGLNI